MATQQANPLQQTVGIPNANNLRDNGLAVLSAIAGLDAVATRIEAAMMAIEQIAAQNKLELDKQRAIAIAQIALARSEAIAAIRAAQGSGLYQPAQHNLPTAGHPIATAE